MNMKGRKQRRAAPAKKALAILLLSCLLIPAIGSRWANAELVVYITETGTKYHSKKECRGLNGAKTIFETTETSAIQTGHTKCLICWEDTVMPEVEEAEGISFCTGGTFVWRFHSEGDFYIDFTCEDGSYVDVVSVEDGVPSDGAANVVKLYTISMCQVGTHKLTAYYENVIVGERTIRVTDHEFEKHIVKEATCAEDGTEEQVCKNCGIRSETDIPATGKHDYARTVTAATCESAGIETYTCKTCGDSYSLPIAPLGHNYKRVKAVTATAVREGYEKYKCSRCGNTYKVSYGKLPASVVISQGSATLKKGNTLKLKIIGKAKGDSVKSWKSSKPKVASVSSGGKVKALKQGTAVITLKMKSGCTAKCRITVKKK